MARFFTYQEAYAGTAAAIKSYCESAKLREQIHFLYTISRHMPDDFIAKKQYRDMQWHRSNLMMFEGYIVSLSSMREAVREALDSPYFAQDPKDRERLLQILKDSEGFSEKVGTYGPAERRYCLA